MRHVLMISGVLGSLALSFAASSVAAAPLLGATTLANAAPSSVEPAFFFRCGIFGQRCRHDRRYYRDGRRYYRR